MGELTSYKAYLLYLSPRRHGSFYAGSKWKVNVNEHDGVVEMGCCSTIDEKRIGGYTV